MEEYEPFLQCKENASQLIFVVLGEEITNFKKGAMTMKFTVDASYVKECFETIL